MALAAIAFSIIAAPFLLYRTDKVVKGERQILNGILTEYEWKRTNRFVEWLRKRRGE